MVDFTSEQQSRAGICDVQGVPNYSKMKRNPSNPDRAVLSQGAIFPFLVVGTLWLVLGLGLSIGFSDFERFGSESLNSMKWMVGLWLLCLVDLFTAGVALQAAIQVLTGENLSATERAAWIFRATIWGTLKLVCLAVLVVVLIRGQTAPKLALVLGLSTLVVVPLVAGIWWSRKEAKTEPEHELITDETFVYPPEGLPYEAEGEIDQKQKTEDRRS